MVNISTESDSTNAVSWVSNPECRPWRLLSLFSEIDAFFCRVVRVHQQCMALGIAIPRQTCQRKRVLMISCCLVYYCLSDLWFHDTVQIVQSEFEVVFPYNHSTILYTSLLIYFMLLSTKVLASNTKIEIMPNSMVHMNQDMIMIYVNHGVGLQHIYTCILLILYCQSFKKER